MNNHAAFRALLNLLLLTCVLHTSLAKKNQPPTLEAFANDYVTAERFLEAPRWYDITVGYAVLNETPPGQSFIIQDMPKAMHEAARMKTFTVMGGHPHTLADYSMISTDPLNQRLAEPFALGQVTHALVKDDTNEGILLSFMHYKAENVNWSMREHPKGSDYSLDSIFLEREQALPSNTWFIITADQKRRSIIRNSEQQEETLYVYFFIKVMRGSSVK